MGRHSYACVCLVSGRLTDVRATCEAFMTGEYNVSYGYDAAARTFLRTFLSRTGTRLNHLSRHVAIPGIPHIIKTNRRQRRPHHVVSLWIPNQRPRQLPFLRHLFRFRMGTPQLRTRFGNLLRQRPRQPIRDSNGNTVGRSSHQSHAKLFLRKQQHLPVFVPSKIKQFLIAAPTTPTLSPSSLPSASSKTPPKIPCHGTECLTTESSGQPLLSPWPATLSSNA
jgi:hypothetical protein